MPEIYYSKEPDMFGQHSAHFFVPIDMPLYSEQCDRMSEEVDKFILQELGTTPVILVGHDDYGSFRIKISSEIDGKFEEEEVAALERIHQEFFERGSWDSFPIVEALRAAEEWNYIPENFDPQTDDLADLTTSILALPEILERALYQDSKRELKARMIEKYEEAAGRKPLAETDGDFVAAIVDFEFTK